MSAAYRCGGGRKETIRRERGQTCGPAAGIVIDEVTKGASPKRTVSSKGQSEVVWRSECNQRGDQSLKIQIHENQSNNVTGDSVDRVQPDEREQLVSFSAK